VTSSSQGSIDGFNTCVPLLCNARAAITPIAYQEIIDIGRHVGLALPLWNDLSALIDQEIATASSRLPDPRGA
jgi:hypothetical protein